MKNSILQWQDFDENKKYLGSKTLNLKRSVDFGLNVPKFVAIPSYSARALLQNEIQRVEVAQNAASILQSKRYAVRSSALIEDGKKESFAGQFLTKINVSAKDLDNSIYEVLKQAEGFLKGDLDKFSIIIQEYIDADIAGVAFTRNPNGDREMVIEYGFCEGEKIVSGQIIPEKISFYWNETLPKVSKFLTEESVEIFKRLEKEFTFPQDIEWCVKDGRFYLLQTRPITTISQGQYEQITTLEEFLAGERQYFYEKTEISEVAPRPVPLTFDLLKRIYSKNSSVTEAYKKFGVQYDSTDFLRVIGNELFVDRENEIHGLLPAYSYLKGTDFKPHVARYSKIFPTIKNILYLNSIKTNAYDNLFQRLKQAIENKGQQPSDIHENLNKFLKDYELIFETNLLSGLSTKKAQAILHRESANFTEILNESSVFVDLNKYKVELSDMLMGNSLDFNDETEFIGFEKQKESDSRKVFQWWQGISIYKKKYFSEKIVEAIVYSRLRELGRILMLKNISSLRSALLKLAKEMSFRNPKNLYFASFDEILKNELDEKSCEKRKIFYDRYIRFSFPSPLTSAFIPNNLVILGVSAGEATGILQDKDFIDGSLRNDKKYILYTETLSPDLTKYFDKISGIASKNGGLLSHLAIIARERGIPVVTGISLSANSIHLGETVRINGSKGEISTVKV